MFDTLITRLFPAALLGGLALYLLATMLWLQPLVERRMAEKQLTPACEVALETEQESTPLPENPQRFQLEMTIRMLEDLGADQIPILREQLQFARQKLQAMSPRRLRITNIERGTICGCSADKAFGALGFGMTFHVASARTYTSTKINSLPQSTLAFAQSGQCGDLPWKG
ncbi:MiAMP1 family antimicrobial peptide [Sulfitobacter mediterraneus]|uniref:MiAMP1 family antimicrobial peptide n=1 Tax=Sulfitobacter mediterraneus TaxID=83219 RepID=UPI00193A14C8|nr:MiAMP1 family antimicrobial peptide [Sulfitobacter mediterraneus]MBM1556236.1 MiAMP1 family antimicrobial peptide [Sulfitobacter mediterraneus]MBM1567726.1 MiAMP1 family antimicrobial peptide [Sulfitobacter mediterraneus]MBM1571590.1 MiAMP1 family antimicrobial peptide [Sulfitobacter mediterraneus]MBM1575378.1 MiAMP1 family antimicrobial peptide [Sulfitobacter mediterraneus]MBM1579131.1 MiAMP1 family antimicrobial peptide [Sulfitobacter mediterraneus]